MNAEAANVPMLFLSRYAPLSFNSLTFFEKNYKRSFTSNDLSIKNPTLGIQAQAIYKFSNQWTSQTVLSRSNTKTNGYYHYLWDFSDGNTFGRYISKRNGETNTIDIQQNFIGDFSLACLQHRLLIGFDYFESTIYNGSTGWELNGTITLQDGNDTGVLGHHGAYRLSVGLAPGQCTSPARIIRQSPRARAVGWYLACGTNRPCVDAVRLRDA